MNWLGYHSIRHHVLVPLWARVPANARWTIVNWLNRFDIFCWSDLVDAALHPTDGPDACDGRLPLPAFDRPACSKTCWWLPEHEDHADCTCYCSKFKIETKGVDKP